MKKFEQASQSPSRDLERLEAREPVEAVQESLKVKTINFISFPFTGGFLAVPESSKH